MSNILLKVEGRIISNCHTKRATAKDLAPHLFEQVRLFGLGRWNRSEGEWNLENFIVNSFEVLEKKSLSETVIALRKLKGEWGENALQEILESRHNQKGIN
jgi:hypothetical protein